MIPVYKPRLTQKSEDYLSDAIRSTWISSIGPYIDQSSQLLAKRMSVDYALLTSNGTTATHLVAKCIRKKYPNLKRVIVPSGCYIAAYNGFLYDGDWEIVLADLSMETWNMVLPDDIDVERDLILAVHNLGNIINVPEIQRKYPGIVVVEDNCEGIFGDYDTRSSGSASVCSSLSFFGNKNITCGEGGAFLTNDKEIYEYAKLLHGQGQSDERYVHSVMGYNYRMTNMQAAVLLGQLEEWDSIENDKDRMFRRYQENLKDVDGISLQVQENNTIHSMWMFGVMFDNSPGYHEAREYFLERGIDTRPMFYAFDKHEYLKDHLPSDDRCVNAREINMSAVIFPSFPDLTYDEIDYISKAINDFQRTLTTERIPNE